MNAVSLHGFQLQLLNLASCILGFDFICESFFPDITRNDAAVVNFKKSMLEPTQYLEHLALEVDFAMGELRFPAYKRRDFRRELAKLIRLTHATPRKVAAILGKVRSALFALPALRAFTDALVAFVNHHQHVGWDKVLPLPLLLKAELLQVGGWVGRLSPSDCR